MRLWMICASSASLISLVVSIAVIVVDVDVAVSIVVWLLLFVIIREGEAARWANPREQDGLSGIPTTRGHLRCGGSNLTLTLASTPSMMDLKWS